MKYKAICINNKEEYVERFNIGQTYEYTIEYFCDSTFTLSPKLYWVYLNSSEFIELYEMDFDEAFIDLAIYREQKLINNG